jgi:hypothetical protein
VADNSKKAVPPNVGMFEWQRDHFGTSGVNPIKELHKLDSSGFSLFVLELARKLPDAEEGLVQLVFVDYGGEVRRGRKDMPTRIDALVRVLTPQSDNKHVWTHVKFYQLAIDTVELKGVTVALEVGTTVEYAMG